LITFPRIVVRVGSFSLAAKNACDSIREVLLGRVGTTDVIPERKSLDIDD
jgi:hypothetical protein